MQELEIPVLEHIKKLLKDNSIPELEGALAEIPLLGELHEEIKTLREIVYAFSAGDFSPVITIRGIIPGCLKALQAHLRHMIWQVQMVEQGDFTQQIQFMGEFSTAFNKMVRQLDYTLSALKKKEEAFMKLQREGYIHEPLGQAYHDTAPRFEYLASHDPLTGVLNRRSFIERAALELKDAAALATPCCIVLMDIDHFKILNDTYGHSAGDDALRHTVQVISVILRKNDFMGRYGGEEFIFLFNGSDRDMGMAIAERMREALIANPLVMKTGPVALSASFGVAMLVDEGDWEEKGYVQHLINNADIALDQAKKNGRNKVVGFTEGRASLKPQ
jgi:diguanylate cyclase (GGDEF)-like protein